MFDVLDLHFCNQFAQGNLEDICITQTNLKVPLNLQICAVIMRSCGLSGTAFPRIVHLERETDLLTLLPIARFYHYYVTRHENHSKHNAFITSNTVINTQQLRINSKYSITGKCTVLLFWTILRVLHIWLFGFIYLMFFFYRQMCGS